MERPAFVVDTFVETVVVRVDPSPSLRSLLALRGTGGSWGGGGREGDEAARGDEDGSVGELVVDPGTAGDVGTVG